MNKTDQVYLKERIGKIVKCTNGNISTRINRDKKSTGLTNNRKMQMIQSGRATLIPTVDLCNTTAPYNKELFDALLLCYDYPLTDGQKKKIAFNKRLQGRIDDLHTEVELEGNRLLDSAVLGLTENKDVPDALRKLGAMVDLAIQ